VDVILGVIHQNGSDVNTTARSLQALLSNSSYAKLLISHSVVLASGRSGCQRESGRPCVP
jgi:hypothetical protein